MCLVGSDKGPFILVWGEGGGGGGGGRDWWDLREAHQKKYGL